MRSKKGEASKFFNVHEGGKMCQAGAKGTFFIYFMPKAELCIYFVFSK